MGIELILFLVTAVLAIAFAVGMLLSENAVHSTLFLIANFATVAFLYLMLDAPFLGMVQVSVYAGAIMVLFLFVIMLLGADTSDGQRVRFRWMIWVALFLAAGFLVILGWPMAQAGGFRLPDYEEPGYLRVVNAIPDAPDTRSEAFRLVDYAVEVAISGEEASETVERVNYGEATEYIALPAGAYTVSLTSIALEFPVLSAIPVTVESGEAQSLIAFGSLLAGFQSVTQVDDLSPAPSGYSRVSVLNTFTTEPVTLVELGPDRALSLAQRTVETTDADGNVTSTMETFIADRVIARDLAFGVPSAPTELREGVYNLVFVDEAFNNVANDERVFSNTVVDRGLSYLAFLGTEPPQAAGGSPRAVLLAAFSPPIEAVGSPASVGMSLFTVYVLPVMAVGLLLLVALVGVVVLSRPDGEKREIQPRRRRVSRPMTAVIAQQTGTDLVSYTPLLHAADGDAAAGDEGDQTR
jgi:NADH:ubiquinone oxidoreductase subunit 6 (subunit J)